MDRDKEAEMPDVTKEDFGVRRTGAQPSSSASQILNQAGVYLVPPWVPVACEDAKGPMMNKMATAPILVKLIFVLMGKIDDNNKQHIPR